MLKTIHRYYKDHRTLDKLSKSGVCILNKLPIGYNQKKTIFNFCFDINIQRWVTWTDLKLNDYPCISSSFSSVTLPPQELLRFNPSLA